MVAGQVVRLVPMTDRDFRMLRGTPAGLRRRHLNQEADALERTLEGYTAGREVVVAHPSALIVIEPHEGQVPA